MCVGSEESQLGRVVPAARTALLSRLLLGQLLLGPHMLFASDTADSLCPARALDQRRCLYSVARDVSLGMCAFIGEAEREHARDGE
jgi:hypothetical protein